MRKKCTCFGIGCTSGCTLQRCNLLLSADYSNSHSLSLLSSHSCLQRLSAYTNTLTHIRQFFFLRSAKGTEGEHANWGTNKAYLMERLTLLKNVSICNNFYFLITYGVCKKRKYCNRMSKKKSLLLTNVHDLYVLEDKTSQKKFPSVCMSVFLSGCLYERTWTFHVDTITFEGVSEIWWVSSMYEMQVWY